MKRDQGPRPPGAPRRQLYQRFVAAPLFFITSRVPSPQAAWLVPSCAHHSFKRTAPVGLTAAVERAHSYCALREQGPIGAVLPLSQAARPYLLLVLLLLAAVPAQAQVYPSDPPIFEPFQKDAYGPGVNSDATGRPFSWQPQGRDAAQPDPTIAPRVNQYGLGQSADQYGRPIEPRMGQGLQNFGGRSDERSLGLPCIGACPGK
jgi:hypothetical protein